MGTPIPPEWPEINPTKWYKATVDVYAFNGGPPGCTIYVNTSTGCALGSDIIDFIDNDRQCTDDPLLGPPVVSAERLKNLEGEFDTFAACVADL